MLNFGLDFIGKIDMQIIKIIESIAVIAAAAAAIWGISSWRREMKGKKEFELAEEVLSTLYEAKDKIRNIRSPWGYSEEGKSRKRTEKESEEESKALDKAFVTYERYLKHQETFNRLHALRYRFMAIFGKDKEKLFIELDNIVTEIMLAAESLGLDWASRSRTHIPISEKDQETLKENTRKHEQIIWAGFKDDPIAKGVEKVIHDIEKLCEPILKKR